MRRSTRFDLAWYDLLWRNQPRYWRIQRQMVEKLNWGFLRGGNQKTFLDKEWLRRMQGGQICLVKRKKNPKFLINSTILIVVNFSLGSRIATRYLLYRWSGKRQTLSLFRRALLEEFSKNTTRQPTGKPWSISAALGRLSWLKKSTCGRTITGTQKPALKKAALALWEGPYSQAHLAFGIWEKNSHQSLRRRA